MNIRPKRRIRDLIRAAVVIILFFGVPVWLLAVILITASTLACIVYFAYISILWIIWRCLE